MTVLVVGAGWSGAVVARHLHDHGYPVEVVEKMLVVGGHARCEVLNGVVYEPNGAHIFHTSDATVAAYVQQFGMVRPYQHRVKSCVYLREDDEQGVLLSWPPQVSELRELPDWPVIERELAARPPEPVGADFETWVISLMGPYLYRLFIEHYTRKQWGCEPAELSSRLAPRRVDIRDDNDTRLFRDTWEFFPTEGASSIIERILRPVPVTCGVTMSIERIREMKPEAVVITAALDDLLGQSGALAWRGIEMVSRYLPVADPAATRTAAYVINHPTARVPFTRTVETKHATGQQVLGTVVSEEYPGAPARHYPVPTLDGVHERRNRELQAEVVRQLDGIPTFFCGRLATYAYIDQDQAIARAFSCADEVGRRLAGAR